MRASVCDEKRAWGLMTQQASEESQVQEKSTLADADAAESEILLVLFLAV